MKRSKILRPAFGPPIFEQQIYVIPRRSQSNRLGFQNYIKAKGKESPAGWILLMELRIQFLSFGWKAIIPAQERSLSLSWNDCFLPLENQDD